MVVFDREYRSLASGQLRWHDGAVGAFSDPRFTDLVPSLFSGSLEGHVVSVRAVLDTRAHQKARSAATRVMLEWRVLGNVLAGVSAAAVGETGDGSRPVPSWPIALIEPAEGATTFIAMAEET